MKIWLDTSNVETVDKAVQLGLLHGVTTNPEIIMTSGQPLKETLKALLEHQGGPVAAQVVARDFEGMLHQGMELHKISDRIVVKVPVTQEGLKTIHALSKRNITTMGTTVFYPHQALAAVTAGACYIAPYLKHIENNGQDLWDTLEAIQQVRQKAEILAASIQSMDVILQCSQMSIEHITIKDQLFYQFVETPQPTQHWVEHFSEKWTHPNFL